ncbi:enoyl-CoA hydratase/isomerase family protein [Nocardia cyriacigeorgica]|uniref:Enoyl-CoA hydratase/isomerase family protein n=2 Tax=Nocardia cyriacigeorgica TaxID=135487 RepID=A0A5R8PAQ0_9NOCA|nr:enoyl-CoA hydratase/isomerase family protein [Nocardia cyriacigeorgica]
MSPVDLELDITVDGVPKDPMTVIELDAWAREPAERIERMADLLADSLRLTVGVIRGGWEPRVAPLVYATTLTLATAVEQPMPIVRCDDIDEALETLARAVGDNPRASVALGRLLRQTEAAGTASGLAAEAAVYSMLLGGNEFERWLAGRGGPRPVAVPNRRLVRARREGNLLSVLLDHPERRNALSMRLREELLEVISVADVDPGIEQVVIEGAGPVFCSGGDLDEFGSSTDPVAAYLVRIERAPWRTIDRLRDKVTVNVQGACIGAGIEMAAFAGRVVAAEGTRFRLPETSMGLVPGAGGTVSIPRRIGRWRAAWMMLTGEWVETATALRWNLIDAVSAGDATVAEP